MKRNNSNDIQIRELLDKFLPQAPRNDWFVKKTLNRLPQKQGNTISIIEIAGYVIAILAISAIEGNIIYNEQPPAHSLLTTLCGLCHSTWLYSQL